MVFYHSSLPQPFRIISHYNDVMMSAMASQITSLTIVYPSFCSRIDQRKHQSSALIAFVRGIHRWPVNSPHKGQVTRKCFHLMTSSWLVPIFNRRGSDVLCYLGCCNSLLQYVLNLESHGWEIIRALVTWRDVKYSLRVLCQKQVSRAGTSNYIPQIARSVINCPYPWYLLLAQHYLERMIWS